MGLSLRLSLLLYVVLLVLAILGAVVFVRTSPPLPQAQCAEIVTLKDVVSGKLVREPQKSILDLWTCLKEYKKDHWWRTTGGIWGSYVVFKIFGPIGAGTSMVLSVLIGALYSEWPEPTMQYSLMAHLIGVSGEVCGGAGAWIMSYGIGREVLLHCMPIKMSTLQTEMGKFQGSMFRYMLFLRISPLFPNWFVNYSTALIGMPFAYFVLSSFLAIQPAAVMSISMGGMLRDVGETGLDLMKMGKQGAILAAIMGLLSLPLIPASDYRNGFNKVKARLSRLFGRDKDKAA